jgi:NAD(P)-dependent dehydrogenase (short-subunit alcohol dehydrogenase family)
VGQGPNDQLAGPLSPVDGGCIVNIGSVDSLHPAAAGLAAYDASKGGLLMFNKSFALEVAPLKIRVNLVATFSFSV